jgi:hypothetical protein
VCTQVHHLDLINFKKICEKILAKTINFSVSSIFVGFVSTQSPFLSIVQQETLRRPHWVTIKSRYDCSSLGISTIFVSVDGRKNIRRFSMWRNLTKICCPRHPFMKLRSVAEADLASLHNRRCCGLGFGFLLRDRMIPWVTKFFSRKFFWNFRIQVVDLRPHDDIITHKNH